jgi:hypothetical protein
VSLQVVGSDRHPLAGNTSTSFPIVSTAELKDYWGTLSYRKRYSVSKVQFNGTSGTAIDVSNNNGHNTNCRVQHKIVLTDPELKGKHGHPPWVVLAT